MGSLILSQRIAARAGRRPWESCAQLRALSGAPFADANPGPIFGRLVGLGLARHLPVSRDDRRKRIELKKKIRMSGSDHLVIDKFVLGPEMTLHALFGATDDVS